MYWFQAQETIQLATLPSDYEYLDPHEGVYCENGITNGPFLASTYRPYIPQSKFEVNLLFFLINILLLFLQNSFVHHLWLVYRSALICQKIAGIVLENECFSLKYTKLIM